MVDFFELDMSPKPVFFQKKKTIFSEMQNLLKVASRTAKSAQTPKVAEHDQDWPSTWSCLLWLLCYTFVVKFLLL